MTVSAHTDWTLKKTSEEMAQMPQCSYLRRMEENSLQSS